jgi:hypothetical protein
LKTDYADEIDDAEWRELFANPVREREVELLELYSKSEFENQDP